MVEAYWEKHLRQYDDVPAVRPWYEAVRRRVDEELTGFPMYGYYPGGDPRDFVPDLETNHRHEVLAWVEACQRWAADEPTVSEPTFPHGVCQADQSLGLGAYRIEGMEWDEEPVDDSLPMEVRS